MSAQSQIRRYRPSNLRTLLVLSPMVLVHRRALALLDQHARRRVLLWDASRVTTAIYWYQGLLAVRLLLT